jgi:hypothetical protein
MDILRALLIAAVPVACFTFLSLQWLIASGRLEGFSSQKDLEKRLRAQARAAKKARKQQGREWLPRGGAGDFLHNKFLSFGGGFYGTMAALTYILIEAIEIWNFLLDIASPDTWFNRLGLQLLIDFVVNSFTNLIAAFVWFATLPDMIDMDNGWIWLGAAYGGYLAGMEITRLRGNDIWRWLGRKTGLEWMREEENRND